MTSLVYGLVVFCVALVSVIAFFAVLHWGRNRETGLLPYLFYPVVHNSIGQVLGPGRNLFTTISSELTGTVTSLPAYCVWASRLTTLYILLSATERIVNRALLYGKQPQVPYVLFIAFVFFFVTTVLCSAFLGTHKAMSHEHVYLFIGGCSVMFFNKPEGDLAVSHARTAIFTLLFMSLIYLIIKPEYVLATNYNEGLIPGLTVRYFGLSSHANTLGPLTVVYLLCLWNKPYETKWFNWFAWILGLATLFFAQSKTSWICFMLSSGVLVYFNYGTIIKNYIFNFQRPLFLVAVLSFSMFFITAVALLVMFGPSSNPLNAFFATQAGADLMSMTGRDQIWEVAVKEWRRNPLFGYGLSIWSEEHRARIGIPAAVTAHSQFYQTLSSAGIVGVVGLVFYFVALMWFAIKAAPLSKGISLAVFMILAFRSISEVPFTMIGYYGPSELTHILVLMVIAANYPEMVAQAKAKIRPKFKYHYS